MNTCAQLLGGSAEDSMWYPTRDFKIWPSTGMLAAFPECVKIGLPNEIWHCYADWYLQLI